MGFKKVNILFLIDSLRSGGAERVLVNLINNLDKERYHITLRTLVNAGENRKFLSNKVRYESILPWKFRGLKYLYLLPKEYIYRKVAHGDFDVIVVYLHGVLTRIVSKAPPPQKTIAFLHADMRKSPFIRDFKSQAQIQDCFNSYNAIAAVSQSIEESFRDVSGLKDNIYVVYNTFDVKGILERSKDSVAERGHTKSNGKPILCAVGTLSSVKGYDRLIKVLALLKQEGKDFILNIIGAGTLEDDLRNQIAAAKLEENVFLLGFQENPYKFIVQSDWLISASYSEGFSSVVVESVILGTPVLTTRTSGMEEILGQNNEYGIIVENSEDSLYTGLKQILENPSLLAEYRERVKSRSSFFSTEQGVQGFERLIEKVLSD